MTRKIMLLTGLAASLAVAAPAFAATWYGGGRPPSSSTSTGGSTQVPEPGVLGLMGAGLIGLAIARRRRSRD